VLQCSKYIVKIDFAGREIARITLSDAMLMRGRILQYQLNDESDFPFLLLKSIEQV
jgi:hypothetical protein